MDTKFWSRLDELIATHKIVIDRPKGTAHPKYPNLIFPLDYGYLEGTSSMDGGGIDVWAGTAPHHKLTAIVCTIDTMKNDSEIKLLIGCTEEDYQTILEFLNGKYMSGILVRREG